MLRREEALSRSASQEAEASCRIVGTRVSPIVPVLVRHLRLTHSFEGYAAWTDIGYRAAQMNPANSRATATTTLVTGFPRVWSFSNFRWRR